MRSLLHLLTVALLAALLALPGVSGGGGPGGGSTGVWVLPLSSFLTGESLGAPRDVHTGVGGDQPLVLQTTGAGAGIAAVFCDELAGGSVALLVVGDIVTIPAALLQALAQQPGARADVLIVDESLRGYVLRIVVAEDRTVTVRVY